MGLGPLAPFWTWRPRRLGVILITGSQAAINHVGIGATTRLTDFSGYWILLVAVALTVCLLAFAPGLDVSRLVTFDNFSGTAGGGVWPATEGLILLFALGVLLPAYTITGFDASAHAAEETIGAPRACRAVLFARSWFPEWRGGSCWSRWSWPLPASPRRPRREKEHSSRS